MSPIIIRNSKRPFRLPIIGFLLLDCRYENYALSTGETDIKFNFIKAGNIQGKGELYVNGELKAEVDMPQMHLSTFSLSETYDLGEDTGTPVSDGYKDHFYITGDLKKVVISVLPDPA